MKRMSNYLNEIARESDIFYQLSDDEFSHLREVFLEMYQDIADLCEKHNLTVMLGFGSVLGAIRHKGFIPWDDDFDMIMPRKDVMQFRQVFNQELSHKYVLCSPRIREESKTLYMQVIKKGTTMLNADDLNRLDDCGIRVDVYPIDCLPDNMFWREIKIKLIDLLRVIAISVSVYKTKNKYFKEVMAFDKKSMAFYYLRYFIGAVFSAIGKKNLYDLYDWFSASSKGKRYSYVPTGYPGKKSMMPTDCYIPFSKTEFEGREVNVPGKPHEYLSKIYGDYMKLPPEDERERHFYIKFGFDEE